MSRIGKYPVKLPAGVQADLAGGVLKITGQLGETSLAMAGFVDVIVDAQQISIVPRGDTPDARMMWGTVRARIANMIIGVSSGFRKTLEITGTGYRAAIQGSNIVLNLGYSHDIVYAIPSGIKMTVTRPTSVTIEGVDKQQVGQVAAELRAYRYPEPYKGKGIRYDGEIVRRKEGKKK